MNASSNARPPNVRARRKDDRAQGRATRSLAVMSLAVSIVLTPIAAHAEGDDVTFPWTRVPTRVDPSRDARPRLPPRSAEKDLSDTKSLLVEEFPMVAADASFLAEGRRWRIAHVILPDRQKRCETEDRRHWRCGVRSWARFSGILAGVRLRCRPAGDPDADVPSLECYRHGRSIAATLLLEGWAEPSPDAPIELVAAHDGATRGERGLWSPVIPP